MPVPAAAQEDPCAGSQVNKWNGYVPLCLSPGDQYRILFVTAHNPPWTDHQAESHSKLDRFVRRQAEITPILAPIKGKSKVLGSHRRGPARALTTGVGDGIQIFYFHRNRVAKNYKEFYEDGWDSQKPTTQFGLRLTETIRPSDGVTLAGLWVMTGSDSDGSIDSSHFNNPFAYHDTDTVDIVTRQHKHGVQLGRADHKRRELDAGDDDVAHEGTGAFRVYALSDVLTDPTHAATGRSSTSRRRALT